MNINNFWGDLTDNSSKKEALQTRDFAIAHTMFWLNIHFYYLINIF